MSEECCEQTKEGLIRCYNEEQIHGKNVSLNYREMWISIENVKEDFLGLDCVNRERKE